MEFLIVILISWLVFIFNARIASFLLFTGLLLLALINNPVNKDYQSYMDFYDFAKYYDVFDDLGLFIYGFEPIHYLLSNVFYGWGLNGHGFISIYILFIYLIILKSYKELNLKPDEFYLSLILLFLLVYFSSTTLIRQFLAVSIASLGMIRYLKRGGEGKFILFIALASIFHFSALVMVFFPLLSRLSIKFDYKLFCIVAIISISFVIINPLSSLISIFPPEIAKFERYFFDDLRWSQKLYTVSNTIILSLFFFFVCSLDKGKQKGNVIANIFFAIILIRVVTLGAPSLSRLSIYLYPIIPLFFVNLLYRKVGVQYKILFINASVMLFCLKILIMSAFSHYGTFNLNDCFYGDACKNTTRPVNVYKD